MRPSPWLTLFYLLLAGLALLGIGAFRAQREYQTRGIPAGFVNPIPQGGAQLGLNVALSRYDDDALAANLAAIAATGVTAVKQSFYFPSATPYDWAASDRLVNAVAQQGLRLIPLLDGDPGRAYAPPNNPDQFAQWAGQFAARYAPQLSSYIIWDEPNLASHWGNQDPNPAEYAALLTAAAQAIRQADPEAIIVAAPLAPTTETGPRNIADPLYLAQLYAAGAASAFDVVAAKPYGFDTGPDDRRVSQDTLNFSRAILLREVMLEHGGEDQAIWAGNWGWNSLPAGWPGQPSLWGQTDEQTQASHTLAAWERARREWPWMGYLFLENWEPDAPPDDPRWGFSIAGRATAQAIQDTITSQPNLAFPGYHLAQAGAPGQVYTGTWRFSPEFGADISQTGDRASLHFWGTDVALRVRRADYRARLYITIDGQPANALPNDQQGTALVLTSPDRAANYLSTELVARNLPPGEHLLTLEAWRGWDQWALNGFQVAYQPPAGAYHLSLAALALVGLAALLMAWHTARQVDWGALGRAVARQTDRLGDGMQLAITALAAAIVTLAGWLTWGAQADGLYRRLGDTGQLALTAGAAALFYVTPAFFVYVAALLLLFVLIYARPVWGLAIIAFSIPFYVLPKPMLGYRFSPVEVFVLVTLAACGLHWLRQAAQVIHEDGPGRVRATWSEQRKRLWQQTGKVDLAVLVLVVVATLSLPFSARQDVAANEWRVLIVEPALFYLLLRANRLRRQEVWTLLDAFVAGGLLVALYGLWEYARWQLGLGDNVITVAGGLARLLSVYGSPNNVALYLGRVFPFLAAMLLLGQATPRRRLAYGLALLPVGLALLLTFSKGAFFLGLPVALLILLVIWRRAAGGRLWPWLVALALVAAVALVVAISVPAVAGRLNVRGDTSFLRVNLWRSSLEMVREHPITGVGLDNFLYAYRGRYILDAAWQEPDLSHPHNIVLDFATRLGLLGLLAGLWLFSGWALQLRQAARRWLPKHPGRASSPWPPVIAGLLAAFGQGLAHGLVDHSFFLVDLACAFFLMLAITVWLAESEGLP